MDGRVRPLTRRRILRRARPGRPRDETLTARRREEILAVATVLFARSGYRRTDVQVIADRIGVGKGTVYRYFPTKKALFLAAVDRGLVRLKEAVDEAMVERADPVEGMVNATRAYLRFFEENADLVELFVQERAELGNRRQLRYFAHHQANRPRWRALIEELIRKGRLREVPVDRVLDVVNHLFYGTIFANHRTAGRRAYEERARDIADIVFQGILSEGERRRASASRRAGGDSRSPGKAA